MSKLCLGTVQFGMKYGINNTLGQPSWENSFEMLDAAIDGGINVIDTASAYGEAELILGKYFTIRNNSQKVKVISKLSPNVIEDNGKTVKEIVFSEALETLKRLHINQLDGYLLHTPEYVYNEEILDAMKELKKEGYVNNIGVSIYDLKEGFFGIDTGVIDYIQLPYSVLDQRGSKEKFFSEANKKGVKIYTRSAFLQGLFMMDYDNIPEHLKEAVPYLEIFQQTIKKYNVDKVTALLQFVKYEENIDYLVFGVDTKKQLLDNIEKYNNNIDLSEMVLELKEKINNVDKSIIFPSLWSKGKKPNRVSQR